MEADFAGGDSVGRHKPVPALVVHEVPARASGPVGVRRDGQRLRVGAECSEVEAYGSAEGVSARVDAAARRCLADVKDGVAFGVLVEVDFKVTDFGRVGDESTGHNHIAAFPVGGLHVPYGQQTARPWVAGVEVASGKVCHERIAPDGVGRCGGEVSGHGEAEFACGDIDCGTVAADDEVAEFGAVGVSGHLSVADGAIKDVAVSKALDVQAAVLHINGHLISVCLFGGLCAERCGAGGGDSVLTDKAELGHIEFVVGDGLRHVCRQGVAALPFGFFGR